jgi:hypothetical protein
MYETYPNAIASAARATGNAQAQSAISDKGNPQEKQRAIAANFSIVLIRSR